MEKLALVQNLVIRWHHLHCLQSWPPGCVICIATLPWIVLLALSVSVELVSSSARVTSVKSQQGGVLTHSPTSTPTNIRIVKYLNHHTHWLIPPEIKEMMATVIIA